MCNIKLLGMLVLFSCSVSSYAQRENIEKKSWTGHVFRAGLGSALSFEVDVQNSKKFKGGWPANGMFIYGYEYGYHFDFGLHLAAGLNWTIMYPRNFQKESNAANLFGIPYAIWWAPITNLQVSWANENWLAGVGMVYVWALSTNVRYKFSEHFFVEGNSIIWLDRVFKAKGALGEGFDNLFLSLGIGYQL